MVVVPDLRSWLASTLVDLPASLEARAYVVSVLATGDDLSRLSVSLESLEARRRGDLRRLLRVGDWGLFMGAIDPRSLRSNGALLLTLSTDSYKIADRLTRGTWPVFRELATSLEDVSEAAHEALVTSDLLP